MADIFISYQSERRLAAAHLAKILERFGYTVWAGYHLLNGGDFAEGTAQHLREAKAVVALWCKLSTQSGWVKREAALAAKRGILVQAKIEPCEPPAEFAAAKFAGLLEWSGAPFDRSLFPLLDAVALRVGRDPQLDYYGMRNYDEVWFRSGAPSLTGFALNAPGHPAEEPLLLTTPLEEPARSPEPHMLTAELAKEAEFQRFAAERAKGEQDHDRNAELESITEKLVNSLWGD